MKPSEPSGFSIKELSSSTWTDFQTLFESRGGPKNCWCMVWRSMPDRPEGLSEREHKKLCMRERVFEGVQSGLVGYIHGEPVAWCSVAPKSTYKNLTASIDTGSEKVWSIVCFYVRRPDQGKGIQRLLLKAACDYATMNGASAIEAYPVERDSPSYRFMGFVDLFEKDGFSYIGDAGTRRKVYRKALT